MKKNLPVTNKEVHFDSDTAILSTTDKKGILTYANQNFIDISGFSKDDLISRNHNIVRHPDMPPAAFADLWETIKGGSSWMGIVKNRCKNGDHYWVDAFVTPISRNGEIVEYQSVRFRPDSECVKRAEKTYDQINSEKRITALGKSLSLQLKVSLMSSVSLLPLLMLVLLVDKPSAIFTGGAVLLSVVLAFCGSMFLLQPLKIVIRKTMNVVDNPLMRYIYTGRTDEAGQLELALKMTRSELDAMTGRMTDVLENLGQAIIKTAVVIEQTSQGMNRQKEKIALVVTAMTKMSASVREVANNSSEAAVVAGQGKERAVTGSHEVTGVLESIKDVVSESKLAATVIDQLGESSKGIDSVLDVIRGIADQTNLLALNAAIEAARAGEQGRGFAVVADEVRTLAVRTQEATGEIQKMIEQLQQKARRAVHVMDQGSSKAQLSVEKGEHARNAFDNIAEIVTRIDDMNSMVATAVGEQNSVTDEISHDLSNINLLTDETAAGAASATRVISELSLEMKHAERLVEQFIAKRRALRGLLSDNSTS